MEITIPQKKVRDTAKVAKVPVVNTKTEKDWKGPVMNWPDFIEGCHQPKLTQRGTVLVWGSNKQGQTNIPKGLYGVVAIATGYRHTVVLRNA